MNMSVNISYLHLLHQNHIKMAKNIWIRDFSTFFNFKCVFLLNINYFSNANNIKFSLLEILYITNSTLKKTTDGLVNVQVNLSRLVSYNHGMRGKEMLPYDLSILDILLFFFIFYSQPYFKRFFWCISLAYVVKWYNEGFLFWEGDTIWNLNKENASSCPETNMYPKG